MWRPSKNVVLLASLITTLSGLSYLFTPDCTRTHLNAVVISTPRSSPVVLIGIHSVPKRLANRAFLRSVIRVSLPDDFAYEFVFSKEGLPSESIHAIAAELLAFNDSVVVEENAPFESNSDSHYKTLRWIQKSVREKPWIKYLVKTDDDTFVVYERLKTSLAQIDPRSKYAFFGRDDVLTSSGRNRSTYMVGFLYGFSYPLARLIALNETGSTLMVDSPGFTEDLQTAHWVHLLQGDPEPFGNEFREAYAQNAHKRSMAVDVKWVDWGRDIGQPSWVNQEGWTREYNSETLALHGLKTPEHLFRVAREFCEALPAAKFCSAHLDFVRGKARPRDEPAVSHEW